MNCVFPVIMLSTILLGACGTEAGEPDSSTLAQTTTKHFFSQPYECARENEVTSKRTGKTSIVTYRSYYAPEKGWRIDLRDGGTLLIANLHTPTARYDGTFTNTDGVIADINFATAWPSKTDDPDRALNNLSKMEKGKCKLMEDATVFDIDYLDTLEVMGG